MSAKFLLHDNSYLRL